MNIVLILTDTQTTSMLGCYGNDAVDTPNLDRLAASGVRFNRCYTTCPLCTPARSAIFSGLHPQVNGAWANNMAPAANVPLMGTIFRHYGYRAGYSGKWHLDGGGYFGDGVPGGGFEGDWWYDGKRYAQDIGPEMFRTYKSARTPDELRRAGFTQEAMWGHRVANRAIDFLQRVGDDPFVLVVSFDEPHGPSVAPPEYWERFSGPDLASRFASPPNFNASLKGKPRLQQIQAQQIEQMDWPTFLQSQSHLLACNSYIDREIGRVIDAVDRHVGSDTAILYTSDHGDMRGAHGLSGKGPMVYQEICNVPLIARLPGGKKGVATDAVVSHIDLLPTMLQLTGFEPPPILHGRGLAAALEDPGAIPPGHALLGFHRFAINHDNWGEFYPLRCITDGRYKLAINMFDTDELYDLATDPYEMRNLIDAPEHAAARDGLHDALLEEMDRIRDPFRSFRWGDRPWRSMRCAFYRGGLRRNRPMDFSFQPSPLEAD
jgi:arylsulfatase A-like enzyme